LNLSEKEGDIKRSNKNLTNTWCDYRNHPAVLVDAGG
jgi:hypothetical protein